MIPEIDFSDLAPTQPYPGDVSHEEGLWKAWDDTELYWQRWSQDSPKACIALM